MNDDIKELAQITLKNSPGPRSPPPVSISGRAPACDYAAGQHFGLFTRAHHATPPPKAPSSKLSGNDYQTAGHDRDERDQNLTEHAPRQPNR